jgi:hypothetical protein
MGAAQTHFPQGQKTSAQEGQCPCQIMRFGAASKFDPLAEPDTLMTIGHLEEKHNA